MRSRRPDKGKPTQIPTVVGLFAAVIALVIGSSQLAQRVPARSRILVVRRSGRFCSPSSWPWRASSDSWPGRRYRWAALGPDRTDRPSRRADGTARGRAAPDRAVPPHAAELTARRLDAARRVRGPLAPAGTLLELLGHGVLHRRRGLAGQTRSAKAPPRAQEELVGAVVAVAGVGGVVAARLPGPDTRPNSSRRTRRCPGDRG
jgi:hypothetical protein